METLSPNMRGAIFMMASMLGFVLNDVFMKLVSVDLGLFQAIFIRGFFAVTFMALLAWYMGALRAVGNVGAVLRHPPVLWRLVGEIGATLCFLNALFNMPIANVTAVLQLLPLTITLGAALFLGESVGWRRYIAIVVGFIGVLLILQPGTADFNPYAIWAMAAVAFVTLRDLATRRMDMTIPSLFISLMTAIGIAVVGAIGALFEPWQAVSTLNLSYLVIAAAILMVGYIFSILAMRHGEIGFVSPFRYTILIWALILGMVVFSELPDALELLGAAIVVGSGMFAFYRERVALRAAMTR